ncbi:IclR family transcriptional regulator [Priestia flexa]|uniref:IclR family transcriptional regulator n=1 Tax=Priestia flexa TaxID=86664 RepID=A0A8I1ME57_9BACI|nr:IclR family transcriptional regulator [Priestia flexa]MBN8250993.1 IclR family transcriptional regulator [Priestia flexa]MBN8433211.1 IclR family transcriptional regulator [Priestia flexa]MCA0965737.1 IclR family transcriptional regulator [Priestia flexa]UZW66308.1 IclR family transcriptional regulator [Priestia flexa]
MSEVGTLKKGLDIFSLLIKEPNMTISEMMNVLQYNKSTMYRLVSTLEQNEFIERTADHRYRVSTVLMSQLSGGNSYDLNWFSVPPMEQLNQQTNETIYAGVISGNKMVTTQVVSGEYYSTRTHSEVGNKKAIHANGIGKCILAYQSAEVQNQIIEQLTFEIFTSQTLTSRTDLEGELHKIREQGYAVDNEEGEIGLRCIAAPVRKNGQVIAAVALSGPSGRVSHDKDEHHAKLVKKCADAISHTMTHNL